MSLGPKLKYTILAKLPTVVVVLAFLVITYVAPALGEVACYDVSNLLFYEFGQSSCPFCTKLHEFFKQEFPQNTFFCEIDKYRECELAFMDFILSMTINVTGTRVPVPQTLVTKKVNNDYYLVAIVIGAVLDKPFWLQFACREPTSEVPVYYGPNLIGVLFIDELGGTKSVNRYMVFPSNGGLAAFQLLVGVLPLIGIIGGYLAYAYIKHTKKGVKKSKALR